MLSGSASRHTSVTDSFDRESFNSVEQTFTVVMVSFMVALLKNAVETADSTDNTDDQSVAEINTFTSQVKTVPLLSFCKDRYPCDLRNPRFLTLQKLGSIETSSISES